MSLQKHLSLERVRASPSAEKQAITSPGKKGKLAVKKKEKLKERPHEAA